MAQTPPARQSQWVSGVIVYRVAVVPDGSVGARIGLRSGDILADPGPLPTRLRESPETGVDIPLFRLVDGKYSPTRINVVFLASEERRLGATGDLGFLVTAVEPGSLAARAELRPGDFIPKINETFVHQLEDLKLVDEAYANGTQVLIHVTRWIPENSAFQKLISRRRFQR